MKEEIKKLLEDCECTGSRCPHEISGKHYVMIPEDVDALIDLAVSKERSRIVEWIEERKKDKSQMVYKSYDEPVANSAYLKACDHIINLINTK